ncbi:D-alanyl-D-alanine carboxypeptidase DacC [Fundidesulfovibrio magnetotacticus]|uniref:D-alanyl-D-alanine carboxypeptidase DacC n=1 Tax=Fundidesulfovibrio magnetotacticus TaxID=2730080 RepID=A0A6V8LKM9_9BACT|nr:D-alanyl-D-alanine carboxypeptidase family protein [Fundidesulfovibrio magnetotacticus]GFK93252.1 D-alanyl-D-alanine carboxypeptidase DacC [Fundidesulfovibrio magnetotacticus]
MKASVHWRTAWPVLLCLALASFLAVSVSPVESLARSSSKKEQSVKRSKAEKSVSASSPRSKSSRKKRSAERAAASRAPAPEDKQELRLNVKAAILMNMNNGKIYYEHDADERIAPASVTKVLTLYLIREAMAQGWLGPNTPIPISTAAVRTGGSTMSLHKGEKVPLSEIIKGISVVSANNACVAVAETMGKGDVRRFVALMNAKAKSLGMTRSTFMTPNGLPASGQLTTARDLARLSAAYLRRFPESLVIHSMTSHTYHGVTHRNANSLLGRYDGVDGLKTGFVCASGYNISATAKRGNTRLIAVVLGARNPIVREVETARLLEYGFQKASEDASAPAKPARKPRRQRDGES